MSDVMDDGGSGAGRSARSGGASDGDAAAAGPACFTQLQDMPLTSSEVALCSWCPTMDLCVLVPADGQLLLHRMDWQLLWAAAPEAAVTAVAWRPDGRLLAAGHKDGGISIHDVETGEVKARRKAHYAPIAQLTWADGSSGGGKGSGKAAAVAAETAVPLPPLRHKELFAPPGDGDGNGGKGGAGGGSSSSAAGDSAAGVGSGNRAPPDAYSRILDAAAAEQHGGGGASAAADWPAEARGLDLLVAADSRGRMSTWAHGEVQLVDAAAPAWQPPPGAGADNGDACSSGSGGGAGRALAATVAERRDLLYLVSDHPAGGLLLHGASLALLHRHESDLRRCAALFGLVQEQLAAAARALTSAGREWRSAMSDLARRMTQLESDLSDAGTAAPNPVGDLTLLLCAGAITQGLQQFLLATLGEAGLRRLARSIDIAAEGLHTALLDGVLPRLSLAAFALGEMRGLAAAAPGLQQLGLQAHDVEPLELEAVRALLRAERLRLASTAAAGRYRCFFSWLLRVLHALDGGNAEAGTQRGQGTAGAAPGAEQLRDIRDLLLGDLRHDPIGPELKTAPLTEEEQTRAGASLRGAITPEETDRLLSLIFPCAPAPGDGGVLEGVRWTSTASDARHASDQGPGGSDQPHHGAAASLLFAPAAELAARDAAEDAAAARARPLAGLLQHLSEQCEAAFERPQAVISATVGPTFQLRLSPPAAGGSEVAAPRVCAGPPMAAAADAGDARACFACCLPPADDALQARVLLVRLEQRAATNISSSDGCGSSGSSSVVADACVLEAPQGCTLVDAVLYKGQQLAALTQDSGADAAVLSLIELSEAPWAELSLTDSSPSALEQCEAAGATAPLLSLPARRRRLGSGAMAPLGVSRERGLACVVSDVLRAAVFDLEEDEEGEEEEEEEEEEEGDKMET